MAESLRKGDGTTVHLYWLKIPIYGSKQLRYVRPENISSFQTVTRILPDKDSFVEVTEITFTDGKIMLTTTPAEKLFDFLSGDITT